MASGVASRPASRFKGLSPARAAHVSLTSLSLLVMALMYPALTAVWHGFSQANSAGTAGPVVDVAGFFNLETQVWFWSLLAYAVFSFGAAVKFFSRAQPWTSAAKLYTASLVAAMLSPAAALWVIDALYRSIGA